MHLIVDQQRVPAREGEDVLTALVRFGRIPSGCLCMAGDCPHCLATIDGTSYLRMCQTPARNGMRVAPFPVKDPPPLPTDAVAAHVVHRFRHTDVVVIGGGRSGTAEAELLASRGSSVEVVDPRLGRDALAIYPGPEVLVREGDEIVRFHAGEVVVATGRLDIQPVVPGNELAGLLTARAAARLAAAGVELGRVVAVGPAPTGVTCEPAEGRLVRFEGERRVVAVVVADGEGNEVRYPCEVAVVDMGTYPRDVLARMAPGEPVRVVGGAARPVDLPPRPSSGTVCPCSDVTIDDLHSVWERGFRELELVKRATLAGTGTCQGAVCGPYLRSFVADRGGELQPSFTARPLARQMTMGEAAAAVHLPPVHRTGLDAVHRRLGARMDRVGGWWRPWTYGDFETEYRAVREAVSLGDVGTLGKVLVGGPDSIDFLERLYPCRVADLTPGRSRYALVLAESGGLLDDGLISRLDETTFALTFTSGGASFAEAWLRDWAATFRVDVRIMDRTHSLGAINVTGPRATELMGRAGLEEPVAFMRHSTAILAGVPCRIFRLSFTGEVSYELHHPFPHSRELWSRLMELGSELGARPHGISTLQTLRLEKGHVIVGMDTEPDSTPRRLGMEWAVRMDKPEFVGRDALERTARLPLDRRLVGLTMEGAAPLDGTPVYLQSGALAGYVTSAARSPVLQTVVMLAWVDLVDGEIPEAVVVDGREARHAPTPFYDPAGDRARS